MKLFKDIYRWFMIKMIVWKINSLRRAIEKNGWIKSEQKFLSLADNIGKSLWGNIPVQGDYDLSNPAEVKDYVSKNLETSQDPK